MAAGRKVNLAIRAGEDTPCWLFETGGGACGAGYTGTYAGARRWRFEASPHQGLAKPVCETVDIAAPWDPVFLAEWDAMLAAVAQHLHDIGAYDSVVLIRLTGINRTTDEFRLPEEILQSPCTDSSGQPHVDTNSISTWLAAGYRPALLEQAWDSITSSFARNFPDKTFNVPIIPIGTGHGQNPFPEIDDNGCVYTALVDSSEWPVPPAIPPQTCANTVAAADADGQLDDVLFDLLGIAAAKFPAHLVVEFENLELATPASPTVVDAAQTLGTMTGFMTNNYMAAVGNGVGAACSGGFVDPQVCPDSASYLSLLNVGVYPCRTNQDNPWCQGNTLQSPFIEIFAPDAAAFPDAVLQGHIELHRSPNRR